MKRTIEISEIIKLYLEGVSTSEIAKLANISQRYVEMILTKNHIEKRPFGHWKRLYTLNENFFKTWSNTMAYILGFFVADGFVDKEYQMISFGQKEKYILEQIRNELGSNQPIHRNKLTGVYMLNLCSMVMKKDIIEIHNIKPHKSLDVEFPFVPEKYMSHFIRGYFDGDGNIDYRSYTVSFVGGSHIFMVALIDVLKKQGISSYIKSKDKYFRVKIAGRKSIKLFSNWIYKDKTIFLERKYKMFQKEKKQIENLQDAKHKTNKEAVKQRKTTFLQKYKQNNCIHQACEEISIKYSTFQTWLKNDTDFVKQYIMVKNREERS